MKYIITNHAIDRLMQRFPHLTTDKTVARRALNLMVRKNLTPHATYPNGFDFIGNVTLVMQPCKRNPEDMVLKTVIYTNGVPA